MTHAYNDVISILLRFNFYLIDVCNNTFFNLKILEFISKHFSYSLFSIPEN